MIFSPRYLFNLSPGRLLAIRRVPLLLFLSLFLFFRVSLTLAKIEDQTVAIRVKFAMYSELNGNPTMICAAHGSVTSRRAQHRSRRCDRIDASTYDLSSRRGRREGEGNGGRRRGRERGPASIGLRVHGRRKRVGRARGSRYSTSLNEIPLSRAESRAETQRRSPVELFSFVACRLPCESLIEVLKRLLLKNPSSLGEVLLAKYIQPRPPISMKFVAHCGKQPAREKISPVKRGAGERLVRG